MVKNLTIILVCAFYFSCSIYKSTNEDHIKLYDGDYHLEINESSFQLEIFGINGESIVPKDSISGLLINGSPVINVVRKSLSKQEMVFSLTMENQTEAEASVFFKNGIIKVGITPNGKMENKVSVRFGGMALAHGLGDAGAFGDRFNLVEKDEKKFEIVNNGGTKRWLSTFVIFPKNQFASVFFNRGKKSVTLGERTFQLNTEIEGKSIFYFFYRKP